METKKTVKQSIIDFDEFIITNQLGVQFNEYKINNLKLITNNINNLSFEQLGQLNRDTGRHYPINIFAQQLLHRYNIIKVYNTLPNG